MPLVGVTSKCRIEIGTAVIGGMLTATFLAPFLIPMFFFVVTGKLFKPKTALVPAPLRVVRVADDVVKIPVVLTSPLPASVMELAAEERGKR